MSDLFLQPGEVFVGDGPGRVRTLLGSCVAIVLWAPAVRAGAMCHFLLAHRSRPRGAALDGRFGDEALALMLAGLARKGAAPSACEAWLFGGALMFPDRPAPAAFQVGRRNGESARALLQSQGIALRAESLFGSGARRVVFDAGRGEVWMAQARSMERAA